MPPIRTEKRIRRKKCLICGPTGSSVCGFPKEEGRLAQWCAFCNVSPTTVSKSSRLCTRHFEAKDLIRCGVNRLCLKSDAVPSIYTVAELNNLTTAASNDDGNLKISIRNNLKSILSKGNLTPNTCRVDRVDITTASGALRISDGSTNKNISNVASPVAGVSSSDFEIISIDLSGNETLHVENDVHIGASYTSGVQSEPHSTTADSTAVSPLNIRNIEEENFPGVQMIPTINRENRQPARNTARALRFIADIKSSDLESPRRMEECLKIIRYEHQKTRLKVRNLQKQNQRLKAKVKTLQGLVRELQKKE